MKKMFLSILLLLVNALSYAQSKVFTEISEDVSSEMKIITQDNALVGYLVFTRLEKASEDSFNYSILLMDENLNDIGNVNFREESLNLEAVSFEEDVLCVAYLKSNVIGKEFKNDEEFKKFGIKNFIFTQFLTLTGKLINTVTKNITLKSPDYGSGSYKNHKFTYDGWLSHGLQLRNMQGIGFTCFYGDKYDRKIINYNLTGNIMWEKDIPSGVGFSLLTSKSNIYLLEQLYSDAGGNIFFVLSLNGMDGTEYYEKKLSDSYWNNLRVLALGIDPVTNIPYASGDIVTPMRNEYIGAFSIDLSDSTKKEIKKTFIYWNNGSKKMTKSNTEYIYDIKSSVQTISSFRDFAGNTYFICKPKKSNSQEATLLKMNSKGVLSYDNIEGLDKDWDYYSLENPDTKENYIIAESSKNIFIYGVKKNQVVHTISIKDGKARIKVFPAKEGHIMIVETNKKEKYTRLSIEALN